MAVSARDILQIAIDSIFLDELSSFGIEEDELVARTINSFYRTGVIVTDSRVRDVIEDDIADDDERNFVRLLGPHGPIAYKVKILPVYDAYDGDFSPMRIDELMEASSNKGVEDDRKDQLANISIMASLGYLKTDSALNMTVLPNLVYTPPDRSSGMEEDEEEEVDYYQPATRRLSMSAEYPASKRARLGQSNTDSQSTITVRPPLTSTLPVASLTATTTKRGKESKAPKTPSPYNEFMKEEMAKVKKQWVLEGRDPVVYDHKAVFKQAAANWKNALMNPKNQ